jgi:hypothetical protein
MTGHRLARWIVAPVLLALAVVAAGIRPTAAGADCPMPPKPAHLTAATVERVSDGDTVMLRFPDGRRQRTDRH